MKKYEDRLQLAQWILERNLHWISAAEVKTGVVIAANTAALGALAAAFFNVTVMDRTAWMYLWAMPAASLIIISICCAATVLVPQTEGPEKSFIFFGRIAEKSHPVFASAFRCATPEAFLSDCLAQIHRNAEIAREKFKWVNAAMAWSFAALIPWAVSLALLACA